MMMGSIPLSISVSFPRICVGSDLNGTINGDFQPFGAGHNSRVQVGLKVIKRTSKTAGFNNPAGRA